jgi:hypothetical protein
MLYRKVAVCSSGCQPWSGKTAEKETFVFYKIYNKFGKCIDSFLELANAERIYGPLMQKVKRRQLFDF